MRKLFFSLLFILFGISLIYSQETRLLRFPTIQNEQVVFTYAGDLYTTSIDGGTARRLTSHSGYEMFAKISPDGKYIAFTAQYDGNTEVYLMPAEGGTPRRLTFTATLNRDDVADRMGPNNIVMDWSPDSKNIIFRSRRYSFNSFRGQLFTVSITGELPKELPITDGGFCSYSEDGKYLAFNKIFREFRTWKYYAGGMTADIWVYDFAREEAITFVENDAQDIFPMWHKDQIFFLSDRDRIMNLFVYDNNTLETTKVTNFEKYDIKFPSIGGDKIIFEQAGYLYYYDITNKKLNKISISINNDFSSTRNKIVDVGKNINSADISPDGNRLVFGARGDIFSVPAKSGVTRNLTKTSGVHERNAIWSPDGKNIAFISDKSGEFEIYIQIQDGSEQPIQITKDADTYKFRMKWSPDSKKIIWYDKMLRLRYVDIETKEVTEVDKSDKWEITNFNWSPDSKWITYSLPNYEKFNKIIIFSTETKEKHEITDGWFESNRPTFSNCGKYLIFVSERTFEPIYSQTEWNHAYRDMSKIYLITLQKDTPSPFDRKNNEVGDIKRDTASSVTKNVEVKIDFDGIKNRIVELPLEASNYWNIYAVNNKIFYNRSSFNAENSSAYFYDLKKQKEQKFGTNIGFTISAKHNKMLIRKNRKYAVVEIPRSEIHIEKYADLSAMKINVNYEQEWKQIYDETWRQMRDFFYDPGMHGLNWDSIYTKYVVFLPHIKHRNDLTYIMGEMIGELNIGHAYVGAGDRPKIDKVYMGLLGARFSKDDRTGYFKVEKILQGANWTSEIRSPLTEIGVNVNEGDYIIAINGIETKNVNNIFELLINTAGQQVELTVNSEPEEEGSRNTIVIPLSDESSLYYHNWVHGNIKKVDEATGGQVGYLHIPDMGVGGLNEFAKYYYPQVNKKALIIDDRGNGGGNVSPMIIERLRRVMVLQRMLRNVEKRGPTPTNTVVGPKVLLINEYSASDGDLFPYKFKQLEMGTIIGKRSWGGVVGIRGSLPFVDGGTLSKPEFGTYSKDGSQWIIEGYGVDPDIEIENNPADVYKGKDAQLDEAIKLILEQIKSFPDKVIKHPEFPDKNE